MSAAKTRADGRRTTREITRGPRAGLTLAVIEYPDGNFAPVRTANGGYVLADGSVRHYRRVGYVLPDGSVRPTDRQKREAAARKRARK